MRSRYFILVFVFAAVACLWTIYLFSLQIFDPFNLASDRRIRYTPHKEILVPTRGAIYDANGSLLVSSMSYYQIDIDRSSVSRWAKRNDISIDEAYRRVATAIGENSSIGKDNVFKRLKQGDRLNSIQITNRIRESELERIIRSFDEQKLPGLIHSFSSMRRLYSKDILAARLLGSVKAESDGFDPATMSKSLYKLKGICGVEATYDQMLSGEYGWREYVVDAHQERVPYPNLHQKKPMNGLSVKLTIDSSIQEIVENALYEGVQKYSAKNAGAVVMDPHTGRIMALAGVAADDKLIDPGMVRVRPNIPLSFMFEPGSTQKPLTMLAALEHKVVKPNELIPCGTYQVGRRTIGDTHHYGPLNAMDIIAKSSNVGVAKLAERIGSVKMYEKFISLGYGQKSGLNFYGESSGMFAKLDNWDGYTLHSISFGQGMSVTALQHAAAFSAVSNGGKFMKPMIVDSFMDENGRIVEQFEPTVLRQVSHKAVADTVLSYMQAVVDHGTGKHIKMEYISLAGKTGTAQKNVEGTRGYSSGQYNAVWVGMFPAENPQMVIVVFYDEPAIGYHYGSTSAAPTFKKIVEDILFMPDCKILAFNEKLMQSSLKMPDLKGKPLSQAEGILNRFGFQYKIEGADSSSIVIDQFPKANVSVDRNHPITIKVGKSANKAHPVVDSGIMPDLSGLTLRKALQLASHQKVALKIQGSGIVRRQSIQPGSRILPGAMCMIEATL